MCDRTVSKLLVALIIISMVSAAMVSLNVFTVFAQPVTLEDVIAEIDAINDRLDDLETDVTALNSIIIIIDDIQSQLDSISTTTATTTELAILDSASPF